jgi:hypothetical protein
MAKRGARKVPKADFIEAMECLPVTKISEGRSGLRVVTWRSAKQAAKFAPLEYFNAT